MTPRQTLLAQLSAKVPGMRFSQTEDIAVEALGHILSNSRPAMKSVEDLLESHGSKIGPIKRVWTQVTGDAGERPDLAGTDEHGVERLLIEAKFWAGLTENQPVEYLSRLESNPPSALLVVAPAARFESLWAELRRRVQDAKTLKFQEGQRSDGVWASQVDNGVSLLMTSWEVLLGRLSAEVNAAGDVAGGNDIEQLRGLTQREDSEAFLPLRPGQLGPDLPRLMLQINQLVDDAVERARSTAWLSVEGMLRTPKRDGYLRYFRLGGVPMWLAVNFEYWSLYRETPVWLGFQEAAWGKTQEETDSILQRLDPLWEESPPGYIDEVDSIPIMLRTGVEYEALLSSVVERLEYVAGLLDPDKGL